MPTQDEQDQWWEEAQKHNSAKVQEFMIHLKNIYDTLPANAKMGFLNHVKEEIRILVKDHNRYIDKMGHEAATDAENQKK